MTLLGLSTVDPAILPALNEFSTCQSAPTEASISRSHQILDYLTAYPNESIQYSASDMPPIININVAYVILPKARSLFAVHHSLSHRMMYNKVHEERFVYSHSLIFAFLRQEI